MPASKLHAAKPKGTGSGRKLGKLAQLMNMPLDVFFEVHLFTFPWSKLWILILPHCRLLHIWNLLIFSGFRVFQSSSDRRLLQSILATSGEQRDETF